MHRCFVYKSRVWGQSRLISLTPWNTSVPLITIIEVQILHPKRRIPLFKDSLNIHSCNWVKPHLTKKNDILHWYQVDIDDIIIICKNIKDKLKTYSLTYKPNKNTQSSLLKQNIIMIKCSYTQPTSLGHYPTQHNQDAFGSMLH